MDGWMDWMVGIASKGSRIFPMSISGKKKKKRKSKINTYIRKEK